MPFNLYDVKHQTTNSSSIHAHPEDSEDYEAEPSRFTTPAWATKIGVGSEKDSSRDVAAGVVNNLPESHNQPITLAGGRGSLYRLNVEPTGILITAHGRYSLRSGVYRIPNNTRLLYFGPHYYVLNLSAKDAGVERVLGSITRTDTELHSKELLTQSERRPLSWRSTVMDEKLDDPLPEHNDEDYGPFLQRLISGVDKPGYTINYELRNFEEHGDALRKSQEGAQINHLDLANVNIGMSTTLAEMVDSLLEFGYHNFYLSFCRENSYSADSLESHIGWRRYFPSYNEARLAEKISVALNGRIQTGMSRLKMIAGFAGADSNGGRPDNQSNVSSGNVQEDDELLKIVHAIAKKTNRLII